jgi:Flp pilus assembly pilin Flp
MKLFTTLLRRADELVARARPEEGQAMVEYALLVSLIAIAAFVMVEQFGLGVSTLFSKINAVVPQL